MKELKTNLMRIFLPQRAHILSYRSITFIQQPALSEQSLVTIYEEGVVILLHMLPDHKGVLIFFLRLFENFTSKHNCQPR